MTDRSRNTIIILRRMIKIARDGLRQIEFRHGIGEALDVLDSMEAEERKLKHSLEVAPHD